MVDRPGDQEKRVISNPRELSIALDPSQVMAVVLPAIVIAMLTAIGFDITQAVPLATGDNAWNQAWETRAAAHDVKHGEEHVWQSSLSLSSLNILQVADSSNDRIPNH